MNHSRILRHFTKILASPAFFWGVLLFFAFEALWLVFSAVYPMAFDEDFHFGIIKIYSQHWLPYLSHQPSGANVYGPVTHDPSYLFHYLMSFPYRLIALFTNDQTIQIIFLRLINVALFGGSLILFRRLLLRAKIAPALTNMSLLIFTLIPIVPVLAATINYDNLLMLIVAWSCLLIANIIPEMQQKRVPLNQLCVLIILCMVGSAVKYPFLPIALATILFLVILWWKTFRHSLHDTFRSLCVGYGTLSHSAKITLATIFLICLGLSSQRYIANLAAYHTPVPKCDKVLSTQDCLSYGPWARDYEDTHEKKSATFKPGLLTYIPKWLYGMWFRTFFSVNGNVAQPSWARYQTISPLPLPSIAAVALAALSLIFVILWSRRLFAGNWLLVFFLLMATLYVAALFVENYSAYKRTAAPNAINGRYLLPILFPLIAIAAQAWQQTLRKVSKIKVGFACLVALLFLEGGGVLAFMTTSNSTWYWPSHRVNSLNHAAQNAARKIVVLHDPLKVQAP